MTSFVVLQHGGEPTARALEKTVFVRDTFSIVALVFPIVWLFWHRLWIAGCCALALFIAVSVFAGENVVLFWLLFAFNISLSLLVALEGPALRMAALRFSGYRDLGIVEAENLEQAQLKWALGQIKSKPEMDHKIQTAPPVKYDDDLIFSTSEHN